MGASHGRFSDEELQEYSDLTYFNKKEILHLFRRFCQIDSEALEENRYATIPPAKICQIPELRVNPFSDRICKVFSSSSDGSLMFEDFLDMMSAFSDSAPKSVKAEWAFKIYDFNGDDALDHGDLSMVVSRLTGDQGQLSRKDIDQLVDNVMREADLDDDRKLSFPEFEHVIAKCPDFMKNMVYMQDVLIRSLQF